MVPACRHASASRSLARSHYIVILCTSGPMNMDSLPLHLAGSSSIYAGASSRRSTESRSPDNRGKMQREGTDKGIRRSVSLQRSSDSSEVFYRQVLFRQNDISEFASL